MSKKKEKESKSTASKTTHIRPELHQRLKIEAIEEGISLRELIDKKLSAPLSKK